MKIILDSAKPFETNSGDMVIAKNDIIEITDEEWVIIIMEFIDKEWYPMNSPNISRNLLN